MRALYTLALLAIASPAFAQVGAPAQDQKPVLYDRLMPRHFAPPAPETVEGTTITAGGAVVPEQEHPASPQPSPQSPKIRGG